MGKGLPYLNHANVVCAISDGEGHDTQTFLDEFDDRGLLYWRHPAADDAFALGGEGQQEVAVSFIRERLMAKARTSIPPSSQWR